MKDKINTNVQIKYMPLFYHFMNDIFGASVFMQICKKNNN